MDRQSERGREYRTPPPLPSPAIWQPSAPHTGRGGHALLGRQGAAPLPSWCCRNNNQLVHCIALHCSVVQCSAAQASPTQPRLEDKQKPRTRSSHPSRPAKRSTEQPHIPAVCSCQEALGTERKRERTESCSHWRLPNGAALRSTPVLLIRFAFSLFSTMATKLLIAIVVYCSLPSLHTYLQFYTISLEKVVPCFGKIQGMHIIIILAQFLFVIFFSQRHTHTLI